MSANTTSSANFPICIDSLTDGRVIQVHEKDADSINVASVLRGDSVAVTDSCKVHVKCRKHYVNKKRMGKK